MKTQQDDEFSRQVILPAARRVVFFLDSRRSEIQICPRGRSFRPRARGRVDRAPSDDLRPGGQTQLSSYPPATDRRFRRHPELDGIL